MSTDDVLSQLNPWDLLRVAGLMWLGLLLRLVAVPLVVAVLLVTRAVVAVDTAASTRPTPPRRYTTPATTS